MWQTDSQVLGRIELREVAADDLVRLVPLEALRASVPATDDAFRGKHVNLVVVDSLNEQSVSAILGLGRLKSLVCPRAVSTHLATHGCVLVE